jgi:translation elongation factor EF-Ts
MLQPSKRNRNLKIYFVKKPEAMLDNIAKGKLPRFFKDNTLVNQDYIKDNKLSVVNYVKSLDERPCRYRIQKRAALF